MIPIVEWWQNLEPEGMQTFVTIGLASSLVLFIQMIVILLGGSFDLPDFDLDTGSGGGAGMFSVRGIGAFFTGFGWTGATALDLDYNLPIALIAATAVGAITLTLFVLMMRWLHSLRSDGTMDYSNALNKIGSVYVPIPPKREGLGQIEVLVQDRMTTVRALTDNDTRIGNRTAVKVVELVDERTLLVETLSPKSEDSPNTDDSSSGDSNQNPNS